MPSGALLHGGVKNLPLEMSSRTLETKSSTDYRHRHPFDLSDVRDLPRAINQPIAVFKSEYEDGKKVVLTELSDKEGNNFVCIIDVRQTRGRNVVSFNSVISLYPKDSAGRIAKWFDSEFAGLTKKGEEPLLQWADYQKASDWLANHASDVHAVGLSSRRIANLDKKSDILSQLR
jgi:hypothetical protein